MIVNQWPKSIVNHFLFLHGLSKYLIDYWSIIVLHIICMNISKYVISYLKPLKMIKHYNVNMKTTHSTTTQDVNIMFYVSNIFLWLANTNWSSKKFRDITNRIQKWLGISFYIECVHFKSLKKHFSHFSKK